MLLNSDVDDSLFEIEQLLDNYTTGINISIPDRLAQHCIDRSEH